MKLTPSEHRLVELIQQMPGGSFCPGADSSTTPEVRRLIRRLERRGVLSVEQTQDGFRYSIREAGQ